MVFTIPDDLLKQARMTESDILVELACRLFQTGKLTLHSAAKLANLSRFAMESVLMDRQIPLYEVTLEDLRKDVENLKQSGV